MPATVPYGSWESPITPQMLTRSAVGLGEIAIDGDDVYWVESRPAEAGRSALVRRRPDGAIQDLGPPDFDARSRVHEYGGGAYAVRDGVVVACSFLDQRMYRLEGGEARPITPEPALAAGDRYADAVFHGDLLIAVRERHRAGDEPLNELVAFPADGSAPPRVIASGHDFFSSPRVSPDGGRLAWLAWNHPQMPWDGTELWIARLGPDGSLADLQRVAGGPEESIFQPAWGPDGALHFVSDRTGWWNLHRLEKDGTHTPLCAMEAEFGRPQWMFGLSMFAFLPDGRVVAVYDRDGRSQLARLGEDGSLHTLDLERDAISATVAAGAGGVWTVAAGAAEPLAVIRVDPETGSGEVIRSSQSIDLDGRYVSRGEAITYPTTDGAVAHAFYYPPTNPDFTAPDGERPPLIVWTHGGPTGAATPGFMLARQFWTTRGFALVDVNYRGSVGFGRAYRDALRGRWGVADTDDCVAAARHLVSRRLVDGGRMAIRGGSAGGYTTLSALTFHDVFAAGASYFGVADVAALARDTHKFESRYLDSLVGPYPEAADLYWDRSPLHHTDRLACPMILFQGLDDRVVPPQQAEAMIAALDAKGLPYAYVAFEGEGHGFRRAENIELATEAELSFYGWVFGFAPADAIRPVEILNAR